MKNVIIFLCYYSLLISCASSKNSHFHLDMNSKAILSVLDKIMEQKNNSCNHLNGSIKELPFVLDQELAIDTFTNAYLKLNYFYYYWDVVDPNDPTFSAYDVAEHIGLKSKFKEVYSTDIIKLKEMIDRKIKLPNKFGTKSLPVTFELPIDFNVKENRNKIRLKFSPLIPGKRKNVFEIWLTFDQYYLGGIPASYSFELLKKGNEFIVKNCSWDDEWQMSPGKDYIREIKYKSKTK